MQISLGDHCFPRRRLCPADIACDEISRCVAPASKRVRVIHVSGRRGSLFIARQWNETERDGSRTQPISWRNRFPRRAGRSFSFARGGSLGGHLASFSEEFEPLPLEVPEKALSAWKCPVFQTLRKEGGAFYAFIAENGRLGCCKSSEHCLRVLSY